VPCLYCLLNHLVSSFRVFVVHSITFDLYIWSSAEVPLSDFLSIIPMIRIKCWRMCRNNSLRRLTFSQFLRHFAPFQISYKQQPSTYLCLSVFPHWAVRLPLDIFLANFIFSVSTKIRRHVTTVAKIRKKQRKNCMKPTAIYDYSSHWLIFILKTGV